LPFRDCSWSGLLSFSPQLLKGAKLHSYNVGQDYKLVMIMILASQFYSFHPSHFEPLSIHPFARQLVHSSFFPVHTLIFSFPELLLFLLLIRLDISCVYLVIHFARQLFILYSRSFILNTLRLIIKKVVLAVLFLLLCH
jgi:hypothetical protein